MRSTVTTALLAVAIVITGCGQHTPRSVGQSGARPTSSDTGLPDTGGGRGRGGWFCGGRGRGGGRGWRGLRRSGRGGRGFGRRGGRFGRWFGRCEGRRRRGGRSRLGASGRGQRLC